LAIPALLTILAIGCDDSPSGPEDTYRLPGLVGQWEWLFSCGGWSCATPQTADITMLWVFTPDDFFQWFRSDSLVLSGSFRVVQGESSFFGQMVDYLWVNDAPTGEVLDLVASDTLRSRQECYDCFQSTWVRDQ